MTEIYIDMLICIDMHIYIHIYIKNLKTTSMEKERTRVLEKNKNLLGPENIEYVYAKISCTCAYHIQPHMFSLKRNTLVNSTLFRTKRYMFIVISKHLLAFCKGVARFHGLYSTRRRLLTDIGIPIINLRPSNDRLRFIMRISTNKTVFVLNIFERQPLRAEYSWRNMDIC